MYLQDFKYYTPNSVEEACKLLTDLGKGAKVYCGGSDILPKMKNGLLEVDALVSLKNIKGLKNIQYVEGKGVVIGGACSHNDLVFSEVLEERYSAVCKAAETMAANQIRHIGTIGGNIVSAIPSADLPPILITLNAVVTIVGPEGERTLPLEDVFVGPGKTVLAQNEVLTEVVIPDQKYTGSGYYKFALRKGGALAVVGVAATINVEDDVIKDVKIGLGAVHPTPVRAKKAEEFLIGKKITEGLFEEAGKIASGCCVPISDFRASAEYRTDLVRIYTRRVLEQITNKGNK